MSKKPTDKTPPPPAKQKAVPPKPPAPKPHQQFLADNARSGGAAHGGPRTKARIIRHQGR